MREPDLRFVLQPGLALQVYALPVAGGEPRLLREWPQDLEVHAVSPDGRYALLARRLNAMSSSHSPVRILYVADLQTGALHPYSRGPLQPYPGDIRWDLAGGAVWPNGWQRLALDGSSDSGQALLDRLPPGDGTLLNAKLSPDGRWLAALRLPAGGRRADLILLEMASGTARTLPAAFGYPVESEGPAAAPLQWAPDGSALLMADLAGDDGRRPDLVLLDPRDLSRRTLPVHPDAYGRGAYTPGGRYIAVGGYGLLRPDGIPARTDPQLFNAGPWPPYGSADGRFLLLQTGAAGWSVLNVEAGERVPLRLPAGLDATPLGLSADGALAYLVRYGPR